MMGKLIEFMSRAGDLDAAYSLERKGLIKISYNVAEDCTVFELTELGKAVAAALEAKEVHENVH